MTFDEVFRQLHTAQQPVATVVALKATLSSKSAVDKQAAVDALKAAILRNRTGRALTASRTLLVLLGPEKALACLKRERILRASTFDFDSRAIGSVVADWIKNATAYGIDAAGVIYLMSMAALYTLAPSLRTLFHKLVVRLEAGGELMINNLLAEVDAAICFPDRVTLGEKGDPDVTHEELAEAFSYLLGVFHLRKLGGMHVLGLTSPNAGYNMSFRELLDDSLKICRYREVEVELAGLPYYAECVGNQVYVKSIDPTLEHSVRIGYVQKEMRQHVDRHRLERARAENKIMSMSTFADRYFATYGNQVVQLQQFPIPRFRLELPMSPKLAQLFSDGKYFLEDLSMFESLGWEEYIEPIEVPDAIVDGSITVHDLIKVQRLFKFMHQGLLHAVERHVPYNEQAGLYMKSCLPTFSHDKLISILAFAVGDAKASAILPLLTADLAASDLDIYYTPLIQARGWYMLPMAIISNVNLTRNLLCKLRNRMVPVGPNRIDRMQSELALALRKAGFRVAEEINLTVGKNKLEVDLLAWKDEHVFIFECKNTYHPCNIYELRNTYDAMAGASAQLTLRQNWLEDAVNRRGLFGRIGWNTPDSMTVYTCIALGNRVFNGYKFDERHPVRQVHELCGLLNFGYVEMQDGLRLRLWEYEVFTVGDLIAHLKGSTMLAEMHNALQTLKLVTPIGDMRLIRSTCGLNLNELKVAILGRFPAMPAV